MKRERTPCKTTSLFSLNDLSKQVSFGVMKGDGLDIIVSVKRVLVEENRATCAMGHVEAIREKLVVNVVGRLLQSSAMPPSCNLFLKSIFFPLWGSRVLIVDAESPLHNRTGSKVLSGRFL